MAAPSQATSSQAEGPAFDSRTLESTFRAEEASMSKEKEHLFNHLSVNFEKKRLFVCCDGTRKNTSGTISPLTNVGKLSRAVSPYGRDPFSLPSIPEGQLDAATHNSASPNPGSWYGLVRQLVFYSDGKGSQSPISPGSWFAALVGTAKFLNDIGLLGGKGLVFLGPLYQLWRQNPGYKPQSHSLNKPESWIELNDLCQALREAGLLVGPVASSRSVVYQMFVAPSVPWVSRGFATDTSRIGRKKESPEGHCWKLLHRLRLSLWDGTRHPFSDKAKEPRVEINLHPSVYFLNNKDYFDDSCPLNGELNRNMRYLQVNKHERKHLETWKDRTRDTMLVDFPGRYIVFDARDKSANDPQGWKRGILSGSKPWLEFNKESHWSRGMVKGSLPEAQEPLQDLQGLRRLLLDILTSRFVEVDQTTTTTTKTSKVAPVIPPKARQPSAGNSKGKGVDGDNKGKTNRPKSKDSERIAGSEESGEQLKQLEQ
ncbi:uncharacterized protein PG986_013830 [Apiospora aurea]|uniref:Uncharacterized protein n=1 Tax=Apiospora aurea TaxID=335848 RepID=A0ABR1PWN3_9PEZI